MSINTNDVLSAITQASEALAREPKHLEQIAFLQRDLGSAQQHNQSLELNISSYKSQIESLEARNRSLEVERDQAQFRTLELEEAHSIFARDLRHIGNTISEAILVIDPPKPLPPEPVVEQPSPVTPSTDSQGLAVSDHSPTVTEQVPASPSSTPNPEPSSTGQPTPTAIPVGFAGLSEADVKPSYAGKRWGDIFPRVQRYDEWIAGGGDDNGWNS